jgi:uncharacterized repeat protein (TIGR01451 family)
LFCPRAFAPESCPTGSNFLYTIRVVNPNQPNATNCLLRATLPEGCTFVSATDGGVLGDGSVSWELAQIPANASKAVTITVRMTATAGFVVFDDYTASNGGGKIFRGPAAWTSVGPAQSATVTPVPTPYDSDFHLGVQGVLGQSFVLQNSEDLVNWASVSTNAFPAGPLDLREPDAGGRKQEFYRLLIAPKL